MTFDVHPAAAAFPMMGADDLADLAADIMANGLLEPITLTPDGLLLDGRNRAAACELVGVEAKTTVYDGDPVAFVIALNVHRRHLTAGQRAMIVARIRSFSEQSVREAASGAAVSATRLANAAVVLAHAPDLADAVVSGAQSLNDAYKVATDRKKANASVAEQLAALPGDLAERVTEGDLDLETATELVDERARIALLPDDLAGRVRDEQLAVDEAETIFAERIQRIDAHADNLRDAMRRLARMTAGPIPDELAARFTEQELAALTAILHALEGGDYGFLG